MGKASAVTPPTGKITVNARALQRPLTGVERYTAEVLARLGDQVRVIRSPRTARGWVGHLWEQLQLPRLLGAGDLLWSPANSGPLAVSRQVVTLHDLSIYDNPAGFAPAFRLWYRLLLPSLVQRAKTVITDSDFSRRRITRRLGLPPDKVVVIRCGVDQDWFYPRSPDEMTRLRVRSGLPDQFFLYVGSLERRKNLWRLLAAWERVGQVYPGLGLVIAGRPGRAFRRLRLERLPAGVHFSGYVREQDLPALYSAAEALVLPSLYEGFGLPLLEAMACGTPVICSRIPALVETAGPAGLYFEPQQVEQIAAALLQAVGDLDFRRQLVQRGRERVQAFSWEQTARQVWEVLCEA